MDAVGWVLLACLLLLGLHYAFSRRRNPERRAVQALKRACGGDRELVERLLFAEMQRDPNIDIGTAAQRALRRLARDRR